MDFSLTSIQWILENLIRLEDTQMLPVMFRMSTRLITIAITWNIIHKGISLYFDENTKVAYACSRIIGQDQSCILLNLACGKRLIQILKTKHMHRGNTHNRDATCRQSRNGKCKLEGNCCSNHRADEPILLPAKIMKMINQRCNGKHNCSFKNPVYDSCTPGDPEGTCYLSVDYDCIPDTIPHLCTAKKMQTSTLVPLETSNLNEVTSRYSTIKRTFSRHEFSSTLSPDAALTESRRGHWMAIVLTIAIVGALCVMCFFIWKKRLHIRRLTRETCMKFRGSNASSSSSTTNHDKSDRHVTLDTGSKQASGPVEESGNEYSTIDFNKIKGNTLVSEKPLNRQADSETDVHPYFVLEPQFIIHAFNADNVNIEDVTTGSMQTHPENEYNRMQFNAKAVSKDETYSHINTGQSSSRSCETDEYSSISTVQKAHLKRMDYSHVVLTEEKSEDHYSHLNNEPRHFKNTWNNP